MVPSKQISVMLSMGMYVEEEEEEVLYPHSYYVQSPCTTVSNTPSFEFQHNACNGKAAEASRRSAFSSSRCSSTRESLTSNALDSKSLLVENSTGGGTVVLRKQDSKIDDTLDEETLEEGFSSRGFGKYLSFGTFEGPVWLAIQLTWRFMVSLAAALLVFYLVTRPPPPRVSVRVGGVREFVLAEGVDGSGVSTKILWCTTWIEIVIENHSQVFGLHVFPPLAQMSFERLTFAVSEGEKLVAERDYATTLEMYVGAKGKPMYGGGRMMQDLLDSGSGLPLTVDVSLVSNYRVVGEFIRPWFHHQVRCLVVIFKGYDIKRHTHHFNATCSVNR